MAILATSSVNQVMDLLRQKYGWSSLPGMAMPFAVDQPRSRHLPDPKFDTHGPSAERTGKDLLHLA